MSDEHFFMVWNPNGNTPRFRHVDYDSAEREARRLAAQVPGQEFFVLHAVSVVRKPEPVEVRHLTNRWTDDIPF